MTVSSEIIEVLDYLGEKFGIAIDWTSNNVLPYLQTLADKFIKWEISTSIVWIVIAAFVIAIIIGLMSLKGVREANEDYCDGMLWVLAGVIIIVSFIVICIQIFDIIECNIFPEKALYDFIKVMLNQNS